nr:DoxX family protein [uncultured Caldimonas sp.]
MSASSSLAFRSPDHAALLLRLALGAMWVSHGLVLKLMTFGIDGFTGWMGLQGLPSMLAWPIVIAEIAGGIAIAVGFHGRWVSLALLPILLGATWIHAGNGWVFTAPNGGWEYPVFLVAASIAHFFLGDGAFAAKRSVAL